MRPIAVIGVATQVTVSVLVEPLCATAGEADPPRNNAAPKTNSATNRPPPSGSEKNYRVELQRLDERLESDIERIRRG